jgi:hypothetical protein
VRGACVALALLLTAAAHAQPAPAADDTPPPIDSDQKEILARIGKKALAYGDGLPAFMCTKITRHNVDPSGTGQQWRLADTLHEEFSLIDHKESYRPLTLNGKKVSNPSKVDGSTSSDEFGNLLSWIFDPKAEADFKWNSWTTLNNRRTYVFAYSIAQPKSQFAVGSGKNKATVAFIGLVWADVETDTVVRLTAQGQSPAGSSIQGVTIEAYYNLAKLGDRQLLLPTKSDYRAKEGKGLVWDEVEFRGYRPAAGAAVKE